MLIQIVINVSMKSGLEGRNNLQGNVGGGLFSGASQ